MKKSYQKSLSYFDKYYSLIYSSKWRSYRLGLLSSPKKMFLLNQEYSNIESLRNILRKYGTKNFFEIVKFSKLNDRFNYNDINVHESTTLNEFINSNQYIGDSDIFYKSIKNVTNTYVSPSSNDKLFQIEIDNMIEWTCPNYQSLEIYAFPKGIIRQNIPVPYDDKNLPGFFPIDGASVIAALNLNIKEGDKVLDMCSGPGGKSLILLYSKFLKELVCIEKCSSRFDRLRRVLFNFVDAETINNKVKLINDCAIKQLNNVYNYFDKILVDVPCATDREAIKNPNFSLFSPEKYKARIQLESLQKALLRKAIDACKIGGDIIYSTCTLSPGQNDVLVGKIIRSINDNPNNDLYTLRIVNCRTEFKDKFTNSDLLDVHKLSNQNQAQFGLGNIIMPSILNNYGPGYFCKIRKCKK